MAESASIKKAERKKLGVAGASEHHFVPKRRGGKVKTLICCDCHSAIHAFFTNKELAVEYHTVRKLMSHEGFRKHIKFLAKQDPTKRHKSRHTKERDSK
jgi:hypothetical protein